MLIMSSDRRNTHFCGSRYLMKKRLYSSQSESTSLGWSYFGRKG